MEVARAWHSNDSAQRVAGQVALAKVQASRTLDAWVEQFRLRFGLFGVSGLGFMVFGFGFG